MATYMLVYQGTSQGPPEMTDAERDAVMQAWGAWMEKHSSSIRDVGAPTGDRASVGGSESPLPITGYSLVEADSLQEAQAFCDGHPYLDGAPEEYSIDVYELLPMEM